MPTTAASVHAQLLDFGRSRVRTRRPTSLGGTYRWAAPEVFGGPVEMPLPAADAYSFGCLVYFSATDVRPFEAWQNQAIRAAKFRGDRVLLQYSGRLLLEHSWPLVEQATCHRAQQRPSMCAMYEQIMQWPECQQSLAVNRARPALPGQEASLTFWQEIRHLRQSLGALQFLNPAVETDHAQSDHTLRCPGLVLTPVETMALSIFSAMRNWNCEIPCAACCSFHAIVRAMDAVQQLLLAKECKSVEEWPGSGSPFIQCPRCLALDSSEDRVDADDDHCDVCGWSGDFLQEPISAHNASL